MSRRPVLLGLVPLLLAACSRSPYPDYKRVDRDIHIRLLALGDGDERAVDGDSIELDLRIAAWGGEPGSWYSTRRWYAAKDLRQEAFTEVLQRLRSGDSLSMITTAARLPWEQLAPGAHATPADTTRMILEVALRTIRTPAMIRAEAERLRITDPEAYERRLIEAWVARTGDVYEPWGTSLLRYRITGVARDTARIQMGDPVLVEWRGERLEDGVVIDDTGRNGQPFSFRYGDPDQVMKGIETAVMLLREGQEGSFVIPSAMAFGARGIDGLVEPHSPVVYTVRLLRVERGT
ncbi:MAG: FKBP-type peptidyl-prolyl cis-trans isomerase [Flavobacteriales bacterium]|nr:FKBP-type peptidyl-prolyl cis-trans isomerase [Flavobacteriales bacterium]